MPLSSPGPPQLHLSVLRPVCLQAYWLNHWGINTTLAYSHPHAPNRTLCARNSFGFLQSIDTVRHQTLLAKFSDLFILDCTYIWLLDYFSKCRHSTRVLDIISGFLVINASIVQGSSIGPVFYVINASDLRTICLMNKLFKYADDTSYL